TEIFQALDVVTSQAFGLETVEEVSAQVLVGRTFFEHMVEDHQNRVADRDQSALPAPASRQASVLRRQIGVLAVAGRPSGLQQAPFQPAIARRDASPE